MTSSLDRRQARRVVLLGIAGSVLVLAGCQTRAPVPPLPGEIGPVESTKHNVALIVPLTGEDGGIGTSINNAARLALLDTGNQNIELSIYDSTQGGGAAAASRAIADGNRLILGPLLAEDVRQVAPIARAGRVPVIAFSNDESVAGDGVYILGFTPRQSIGHVVQFARSRGAQRFAGLIPTGVYGQRATQGLMGALQASGGALGPIETFDRNAASIRTAVVAALRPAALSRSRRRGNG